MATSRIVQFYDPDVGAPFHPGETSTTLHNVLKWYHCHQSQHTIPAYVI